MVARRTPRVFSHGPIKTNTAARIIALLAARAAQKFRLAEKLVLVFRFSLRTWSVLSAQKRKLAECAAYCLTRECVCVRPRVLSQGALGVLQKCVLVSLSERSAQNLVSASGFIQARFN
jgi:hypothetical protein